ncbi:MAG: anhydro-N-acetylmuramic acid kinase [Gemmatimonadota bacterium]
MIEASLRDPYFSAPPPKSTGRELFTPDYISSFISQCRAVRAEATASDIIATAVEFTARSIADAYQRFVFEPVRDVVISGGGAKNPALAEAIARLLPDTQVVPFDTVFFDGEAKEAVAFALLGFLHLEGMPGNVPAATGAAGARVLGKFTPA